MNRRIMRPCHLSSETNSCRCHSVGSHNSGIRCYIFMKVYRERSGLEGRTEREIERKREGEREREREREMASQPARGWEGARPKTPL